MKTLKLKAKSQKQGRQYNSAALRDMLEEFINHKEKMIDLGFTTNKVRQQRALQVIRKRLAHTPFFSTQAMINVFYICQYELRDLMPGFGSRYKRQREAVEQLIEYANENNTCHAS